MKIVITGDKTYGKSIPQGVGTYGLGSGDSFFEWEC